MARDRHAALGDNRVYQMLIDHECGRAHERSSNSRGFRGRKRQGAQGRPRAAGPASDGRLPRAVGRADAGAQTCSWSFALQEAGSLLGKWSWEEFGKLPQTEITVDIHCVTTGRSSTRTGAA
jgi:hypothetical protein